MNFYWEKDEVLGKLDVQMTTAFHRRERAGAQAEALHARRGVRDRDQPRGERVQGARLGVAFPVEHAGWSMEKAGNAEGKRPRTESRRGRPLAALFLLSPAAGRQALAGPACGRTSFSATSFARDISMNCAPTSPRSFQSVYCTSSVSTRATGSLGRSQISA